MKINKTILKQIIKEELDAMQEYGKNHASDGIQAFYTGQEGPSDHENPQAQQEQDPINKRIQGALDRWKAGESILKTVDDPNEVIPFVVGVLKHLQELNPDLSPSEMSRTIDLLRTKVLPDLKRGLK